MTRNLAYLDPGTGSIVIQVIVGGVAAIGVMFKLFWHRIRKLFRRGTDEPETTTVSGRTPPSR